MPRVSLESHWTKNWLNCKIFKWKGHLKPPFPIPIFTYTFVYNIWIGYRFRVSHARRSRHLVNWSNNCCTKFTMKLCLFGKKYYNFEKWNRHACLIKKIRLKVLQLFIYGCMNKLIGVRDIILEKWCDGTLFRLWWRWSDHAHQLWLWVDLNNPG